MKAFTALLLVSGIAGCTSQQAYYAGQQWQAGQCSQLPDKQDYDACMSRSRGSYDSYRKEREQFQNAQ